MWIVLNNAFLSIVAPDPKKGKANPETHLVVRARLRGDIERVFPQAKVTESIKTDYRFRAIVSRHDIALALVKQVGLLDYTNFKGSVTDRDRHNAYLRIWSVMAREQDDEEEREGVERPSWWRDDLAVKPKPAPKRKKTKAGV